jgi:5'-methylthioadenosine phosphorylase
MTTQPRAEIGIFGGSGFYSFLDDVREVEMSTPYGDPSAPITLGTVGGRSVAFMPRHGRQHQFPPHMINFRANVWAMKELGVTRLVGPCAVGSLRPSIAPGEFVICDQLVDRTTGRKDTFYDGPRTTHVAFADPYCPELRPIAAEAARGEGITCHERGTMVVIQGPRFSTRAESRWFSANGWDVVGMTQYPEAFLARELEMCFVNVSLVTDYDVGVEGEIAAVTHEAVLEVFNANIDRLRRLLFGLLPRIPAERSCICSTALSSATG